MGIKRKTKYVEMVLSAFENSRRALSVVDLVKRFETEMNKTTVYRVLERLQDDGELHSFTGKDRLKWFAKYHKPDSNNTTMTHPHFQCQDCGKSKCIPVDIAIPSLPNHRIDSSHLLFIGQCDDCLA